MGKNVVLPYIKDIRQGLGLLETNKSKDEKIKEMDPIERTRLISRHNFKDSTLADDFKTWFESQGIVFVDKAKYSNIDVFLKNVEKTIPEDPSQANRYMTMVNILKEIFDG